MMNIFKIILGFNLFFPPEKQAENNLVYRTCKLDSRDWKD